MNSSKTLEKKAFIQHYVLNRANIEKDSLCLKFAAENAEEAWNEIEKICKNVHRKSY